MANYYLDADNGNNSWSGTKPEPTPPNNPTDGPWKTTIMVPPVAGDTVHFKAGVSNLYHGVSSTTNHYNNGTESAWIRFTSYGSGSKPKIRPVDYGTITSGWEIVGEGPVWRRSSTSTNILGIIEDGVLLWKDTSSNLTIPGTWYYRSTSANPPGDGYIYYYPSYGTPADHTITVTNAGVSFYLDKGCQFIHIDNLHFIYGNIYHYPTAPDRLCVKNVIIEDCVISEVASSGIYLRAYNNDETYNVTVRRNIFEHLLHGCYFVAEAWPSRTRACYVGYNIMNNIAVTRDGRFMWWNGPDREFIGLQNGKDCIIEHNYFEGRCDRGGGLVFWFGNVPLDYAGDTVVRNNFIANAQKVAIAYGGADANSTVGGFKIYNNIIYNTGFAYPYTTLGSFTKVDEAYMTIWQAKDQIPDGYWMQEVMTNRNARNIIFADFITKSASVIRIGYKNSYNVVLDAVYIGRQATSGDPYDYASTPTEVGSITLGNDGSIVYSNDVNYDFDKTKNHIIANHNTSTYHVMFYSTSGTQSCYIKNASSEAHIVDVSGYSGPFARTYAVHSVQGKFSYNYIYSVDSATKPAVVTEDGAWLYQAGDLDEVESTPGSWYYDNGKIYIRASTGTPGSNGKVYQARYINRAETETVAAICCARSQTTSNPTLVANNVAINCAESFDFLEYANNFIFKNNISLNPALCHIRYKQSLMNNNVISNNCYYSNIDATTIKKFLIGANSRTLSEWKTFSGETPVETDPKITLTDQAVTIAADSPCRRAGDHAVNSIVTTDHFGNPRFAETGGNCIGAHERYDEVTTVIGE